MIQITPQMHVLVAVEPVDLRKGIDGLAALCREKLQADPFSGWLFVFGSRRATAIRILVYDGQGFWMAHKRLSKGRFPWWPTASTAGKTLQAHQAQLLLAAGNPETEAAPVWRKVGQEKSGKKWPTGLAFENKSCHTVASPWNASSDIGAAPSPPPMLGSSGS